MPHLLFVQVKNPIIPNNALCSDADASAAIVDGANYVKQPNGSYTGYGLDIQNHSWGGDSGSVNVRRAVKGAARNQCVLVCSRGNNTKATDDQNGTDNTNYPATYNDEWVISVGASGSNKERLNIFDNNVGGPFNWSSMYGKKMDVLAPGSFDYVASTLDGALQATKSGNSCFATNYCFFDGTSAAAPHVSGLASLILSKYRVSNGFYDTLEPEDVENLIEKYAQHHAPGPSFYNDDQGWGLINPDNTLDKIKNNQYNIYHFTNGWPRTETNMGNITITVPTPSIGTPGLFGLPAGSYVVEKWKIVENYTNTFGSSEQILGYWPRLNSTNGFKYFSTNVLTDDEHFSYSFSQSGSTLSVTATTYAYKNTSTGLWLNYDKKNVKTAYSVHTYDPTKNIIEETKKITLTLKLYPNPATKKVTLELNNYEIETFQLFDINGKQHQVEILINTKSLEINTANLPNGLYICKTALSNGTIAVNKLLINN